MSSLATSSIDLFLSLYRLFFRLLWLFLFVYGILLLFLLLFWGKRMIVSVENITKYFGAKLVLKDVCLSVEDGARIGLIGANGCGKSTLLRLICGQEYADEGTIDIQNGAVIGFLAQDAGLERDNSIIDELRSVFSDVLECERKMREVESEMSLLCDHSGEQYRRLETTYNQLSDSFSARDGYGIDVKIRTVVNGMGFGDRNLNDCINDMSGGEKTRLALAKLLLEEPQLLILDEPTNHLDFKTLSWLEEYLQGYKGAVLIVSHDRYFLDRTVNEIFEIENHKLTTYKGNYSKYVILREERLKRLLKEYQAQQNEIASLQDYADRNIARASTSQSAKSRLKAIERMEVIEKPITDSPSASFCFEFDRVPHKEVFACENFGVSVGDENRVLFSNQDIVISRGEKVAFIGANGIGKSSFIKAIAGKIPSMGAYRWSPNTDIGFFDQEAADLNPENTVLEELWRRHPKWPEFQVRSVLGRVLLRGEDVYKKVGVISGGERAKLVFAILMAERPNVLLLDEPTNHIDLDTKEQLEKALLEYEGTIILVSHDRYLLNKIPDRIFELRSSRMFEYKGNFDRYVELSSQEEKAVEAPAQKVESRQSEIYHRSKKQRAEAVQRKKKIEALERSIEETDKLICSLEAEIASPEISADYQLLSKKCEELEAAKDSLLEMMDEWAELCEE